MRLTTCRLLAGVLLASAVVGCSADAAQGPQSERGDQPTSTTSVVPLIAPRPSVFVATTTPGPMTSVATEEAIGAATLHTDGVGDARFGMTVDEVMALLASALGEPTDRREGMCGTYVEFGSLGLHFVPTDGAEGGGLPLFRGFYVHTPEFATTGGIRVGSTRNEVLKGVAGSRQDGPSGIRAAGPTGYIDFFFGGTDAVQWIFGIRRDRFGCGE